MVPVEYGASANVNLHQTGLTPKLTEDDVSLPVPRIDDRG